MFSSQWVTEGRFAKCSCGRTEPSDNYARLAFFEFRGKDSEWSKKGCKCGYFEGPHDAEHMRRLGPGRRTVVEDGRCREGKFTPRGPAEFDSFYCGCRGWD